MIITDPESLDLARSAAKEAGVAADRIILFEPCSDASVSNVRDLITKGSRSQPMFVERRLRAGEGKTKIAFLSFSSGTTGKPKVSSNATWYLTNLEIQITSYRLWQYPISHL